MTVFYVVCYSIVLLSFIGVIFFTTCTSWFNEQTMLYLTRQYDLAEQRDANKPWRIRFYEKYLSGRANR